MFETILFQNRLGLIGAVEQNLLKLFEYIINNPLELKQLNTINKVDTSSERIIY